MYYSSLFKNTEFPQNERKLRLVFRDILETLNAAIYFLYAIYLWIFLFHILLREYLRNVK